MSSSATQSWVEGVMPRTFVQEAIRAVGMVLGILAVVALMQMMGAAAVPNSASVTRYEHPGANSVDQAMVAKMLWLSILAPGTVLLFLAPLVLPLRSALIVLIASTAAKFFLFSASFDSIPVDLVLTQGILMVAASLLLKRGSTWWKALLVIFGCAALYNALAAEYRFHASGPMLALTAVSPIVPALICAAICFAIDARIHRGTRGSDAGGAVPSGAA